MSVLQMSRASASRCAAGRVAAACRPKPFLSGGALRATAAVQRRGARKQTVMKADNDVLGASYAIALVQLAAEADELEKVHQDIDALASVFKSDTDVKDYLSNPVVSDEEKLDGLTQIGKEAGFSESTQNFLGLLIQARRFDVIEEIIAAFEKEYCSITDTQVATLTSAVKLEQEQQFLIAKKLQELTGSKNIKLKPEVDESLIAGFIVEYGSSQIDLSVRGQLSKISNELEAQAA